MERPTSDAESTRVKWWRSRAVLGAGVAMLTLVAWIAVALPDLREARELRSQFGEEAAVVDRLIASVASDDSATMWALVADSQPVTFLGDLKSESPNLFRAVRRARLVDGFTLGSAIGLDFDLGLDECEGAELPGTMPILQAQLVRASEGARVERLYVVGC